MARRCLVCGTANHACGRATDVRPVDDHQERSPTMGQVKSYNVGGLDDGTGNPYPADTVLRLDANDAERMGLAKVRRESAAAPETPAKPRTAETRKRPAPAKRTAKKR